MSRLAPAGAIGAVTAVLIAAAASCGRTEPVPWPRCSPTEVACGEECKNLLEDPLNCGACDQRCEADESCINGGCCPVGTTFCGRSCVDLASDPGNCGACGRSCGAGESCVSSTCQLCPAGTALCGGQCIDLSSDPANCGGCGRSCPAGQFCVGGSCVTSCPTSFSRCGNLCVNTKNDRQNCNGCSLRCDYLPCSYCVDGLCAGTSGIFACQASTCTDTGTDPLNCGECGHTCAPGQVCDYDPARGLLGSCFTRCTNGRTACNGTCTDLRTDSRNCGICGRVCPPCTICSAGKCSATDGVLRCGRSCESLQLHPGTGVCSPCSTACDSSGLACQRCAY